MLIFEIQETVKLGKALFGKSCHSSPGQRNHHGSLYHSRLPRDIEQQCSSIAFSVQGKLPHELLHVGKSSEGPDFQHSFDRPPQSSLVKALVGPAGFMGDSYLAWDLKFTLNAGIYAGAYRESAISQADAVWYAEEFVNRLMDGTGETWYDDGRLSHVMKQTPEAQNLMRQLSEDFRNQMFVNGGDFTQIEFDEIKYQKLRFSFSWNSSPTLKILVGGTQEMSVSLEMIVYDFSHCHWMGLISVEIRDDFGVTEGDITRASPSAKLGIGGLTDFWVLQHQRDKKPFTTVFKFSFFCHGNV